MNCPQCQTPNQSDSSFCANCGTRLAPAEAPASAGGYYPPPPGQGAPAGYGPAGGSDAGGYGGPSGYGQAGAPAGQYPPPQQPPVGYQPAGQYQPPQPQYQPPQQGGQFQPRPASAIGPFQFDLNRLTRVDRIVGGASLVVLISIFLPWFSVTVSASTFGFSESGTGSGTSAHGWLWLVFILDLLILAYLAMRAGWEQSPVRLPVSHEVVLIAATALQLLLIVLAFFLVPSNDGIKGISIGWAWGAFVGLLAALVAAGPVLWPAAQSYMQSRQRS